MSNSKQIYTFPGADYFGEKVLIYIKHGSLDKYDLEVLNYFSRANFFTVLCSTTPQDCNFANYWVEKKNLVETQVPCEILLEICNPAVRTIWNFFSE